jgi:hypothetical protein
MVFFLISSFSCLVFADSVWNEPVLVHETWDGGYLSSEYSTSSGTVSFKSCDRHDDCKSLVQKEIRFADLNSYQKKILSGLVGVRDQLAQGKFRHIHGDGGWPVATKDEEQKGLDDLIKSIEKNGLSGWVLEASHRGQTTPNLKDPKLMREVVAVLTNTFNGPTTKPGLEVGSSAGTNND